MSRRIKTRQPKQKTFTKAQYDEMHMAFDHIDKDKSGTLNVQEIAQLLTELQLEPEFAEMVIRTCDTDGDNEINFNEFVQFMKLQEKTKLDRHAIKYQLFEQVDTDHNGFLDEEEVYNYIMYMAPDTKPTKEEVKQLIALYDDDKDGRLSFQELLKMIDE